MKLFILICLFFPLVLPAQTGNETGSDSPVGQKAMQSAAVTIKSSPEVTLNASFSAVGQAYFLHLTGSGIGTRSISTDDPVIFLFDNDSTLTVKPSAVQGYDYTAAVPTYSHQYQLSATDLEFLSRQTIQGLRKHSVLGYDDIQLEADEGKRLQELLSPFLEELKKANLFEVKTAPAFPGGSDVFLQFLNRNFKSIGLLSSGEKTAVLQFRVKEDGSVEGTKIVQSAGTTFDLELLRIVKRMPKWKPALKNNKPVDAMVTQPIRFRGDNRLVKLTF